VPTRAEDASRQISALFGGNLADLRREQGLTQRALAERCGIAPSMVAFIEAGTRLPFTSSLPRLVVGLGIAPDVLFRARPYQQCPACGGIRPPGMMCVFCRQRGPDRILTP
jgi:transcriptional regulator with XRE-family HTH domain